MSDHNNPQQPNDDDDLDNYDFNFEFEEGDDYSQSDFATGNNYYELHENDPFAGQDRTYDPSELDDEIQNRVGLQQHIVQDVPASFATERTFKGFESQMVVQQNNTDFNLAPPTDTKKLVQSDVPRGNEFNQNHGENTSQLTVPENNYATGPERANPDNGSQLNEPRKRSFETMVKSSAPTATNQEPANFVFAVPELPPPRKVARLDLQKSSENNHGESSVKEVTKEKSVVEGSSSAEPNATKEKPSDDVRNAIHQNTVFSDRVIQYMQEYRPVSDPYREQTMGIVHNLTDYPSIVPDATSHYMMKRGGIGTQDEVCYRFFGVLAEKVATDILQDTISLARLRGQGQVNRTTKETKFLLTQSLASEVLVDNGYPALLYPKKTQ